jgi:glycosyltransferase involved in cell wall biosynthesis
LKISIADCSGMIFRKRSRAFLANCKDTLRNVKMEARKTSEVLLVVQNNSVPFDKRVWKEARSLKKAGYNVTVISPVTNMDPEKYEEIEEIIVHRFIVSPSRGTIYGYIEEYFTSVCKIFFLFFRIHMKKRFQVVHVANPPDFFWPLALICRVFGIKFIYDQHDLSPEMFKVKYGSGVGCKLLSINERLTVLFAHAIIVVNESFKRRSINLWHAKEGKYYIVRNGPEESFVPHPNPILRLKYKNKKVVLYIGLMTVNDNIEIIVEIARLIIQKEKREDFVFILLGDGEVLESIRVLVRKYGLESYVFFLGMVDHETVMEYLDIADVCIAPDMPNGMNEYLTLIKILEYMKCGRPFVSFALEETMNLAGEAGLFAVSVNDFSEKVLSIVDNPMIGRILGENGKKLVEEKYLWKHSEEKFLRLYEEITHV